MLESWLLCIDVPVPRSHPRVIQLSSFVCLCVCVCVSSSYKIPTQIARRLIGCGWSAHRPFDFFPTRSQYLDAVCGLASASFAPPPPHFISGRRVFAPCAPSPSLSSSTTNAPSRISERRVGDREATPEPPHHRVLPRGAHGQRQRDEDPPPRRRPARDQHYRGDEQERAVEEPRPAEGVSLIRFSFPYCLLAAQPQCFKMRGEGAFWKSC